MYIVGKRFFVFFIAASVHCYTMSMVQVGGYIMTSEFNSSGKDYAATGSITAFNSIALKVNNTMSGNGYLKGPKITIQCGAFDFTGTIECDGVCKIFSKKPFRLTQFTKSGKGDFFAIVSPFRFKEHTQSSLVSHISDKLYNKCLKLTQADIDKQIQRVPALAAMNFFDGQEALKNVRNELQDKVTYHFERVDHTFDSNKLQTGFGSVGAGSVGLGITFVLYKQWENLRKRLSEENAAILIGCLGIVSVLSIGFGGVVAVEGLIPKHEEKYKKLQLIVNKIDQLLARPLGQQARVVKL